MGGLTLYLVDFLSDQYLQDRLRNAVGWTYCYFGGPSHKCKIFERDKASDEAARQHREKAEAKQRADAEAQIRADAETRAQAERRTKFETERAAKTEAEAQEKAEAEAEARAQSERRAKLGADRAAKADADRRAQMQYNSEMLARQAEKRAADQKQAEAEAQRIEYERLEIEKSASAAEKELQPRLLAALAAAQRSRDDHASQIRSLISCPKKIEGQGSLFISVVPLMATNDTFLREVLDRKPAMLGQSVALLWEPDDVVAAIATGKLMSYFGTYQVMLELQSTGRTATWPERSNAGRLKVDNIRLGGSAYKLGFRVGTDPMAWTEDTYATERNKNDCWSLFPLLTSESGALSPGSP